MSDHRSAYGPIRRRAGPLPGHDQSLAGPGTRSAEPARPVGHPAHTSRSPHPAASEFSPSVPERSPTPAPAPAETGSGPHFVIVADPSVPGVNGRAGLVFGAGRTR